jgi:hypothetical protein
MNNVKAGIYKFTDLRITMSEIWRYYFATNMIMFGLSGK